MAKKKKKAEKPQREFTRRQLSHYQRQKRRQRLIFGGGVFIIAVIVVIVLIGWYTGEYRPLRQTAIRVNDTEFDMGYYIDALRLSGEGQSAERLQSLANSMVNEIERTELVRQEALKFGISISDDEVKKQIEGSDVPINDASLDVFRVRMLRDRLLAEYFSAQVPTSAEQVHIMAMLLESQRQADEIRGRLQAGEDFTALAEEFSLDYPTKVSKGDLDWAPENILTPWLGTSVPWDYAIGSEVGTLSQPRYDEGASKAVGYWLVRVQEKDEGAEQAQVQWLLLGSEEEALDVRARLEAGEDLAALAEEFSQHEESSAKGGEMGVVQGDWLSPALKEHIFNPEVELGIWSEPIRDETVSTTGGYWLIKVMGKDDNRPLAEEDREHLLGEAFNEWVASLMADPFNVIDDSYLDSERRQWAIEQVMKG